MPPDATYISSLPFNVQYGNTPTLHTSMILCYLLTYYEMSGIRLCKHGSDDYFQTALGRQPTFSDTSNLTIISFSHHQAVVYAWEFEVSFSGRRRKFNFR